MAVERDVAIVGVYATKQGRNLGRTSLSLMLEAFHGALADAGLTVADVDGWFNFDFPAGNLQGPTIGNVAYQLGHPVTVVGASAIRSMALAVLGKAMTSRRLGAPASSITIRSNPSAMPP